MEQPVEKQNQPPVQPAVPPAAKKSHAWIWILGGCLGIVIIGVIAMVALGWWGARKAKKELEKYTPGLEQMKENADKWSKESEEWEKKAQELQNSLPNPEDFPAPEEMPK
jgi:cytochrome c-type biogenesis protein CcmH/NrfG